MPIRPQFRWLYPIDWPQLSASIRFERAKGRCERCARPHGRLVCHSGNGRWWDEEARSWRSGQGRPLRGDAPAGDDPRLRCTKVYLSAVHLDRDPTNNQARNLKALCQRCHIMHGRDEMRRRRWLTLHRRKAIGDLFLGLYTFA